MFDGSNLNAAGSLRSGTQSVLTAGGNAQNCPDCPPFPAPSNLPIPYSSTTPVVLTGQLIGGADAHLDNARQIVWQWKEYQKTVQWHVIRSYAANGILPAPGVDAWPSYTDLKATGGGGIGNSWMILGNDLNSMQKLLHVTITFGWLQIEVSMSPSAGFTGGTTSTPPTATDQVINGLGGYPYGTGPAGNQQFYAICWDAPDLSYSRVVWVYAGHPKITWEWKQLVSSPAGWTKNFVFEAFNWGSTDVTTVGARWRARLFQLANGSGGSFKSAVTPAPNTVTALECSLDSTNALVLVNANNVANPESNQFLHIPSRGYSKTGGAATQNGFWGYERDEWFVPDDSTSIFADFDSMGDAFEFIIIGQRVLQWGIGDPNTYGLGLVTPSTNYPTARWYGRSTA